MNVHDSNITGFPDQGSQDGATHFSGSHSLQYKFWERESSLASLTLLSAINITRVLQHAFVDFPYIGDRVGEILNQYEKFRSAKNQPGSPSSPREMSKLLKLIEKDLQALFKSSHTLEQLPTELRKYVWSTSTIYQIYHQRYTSDERSKEQAQSDLKTIAELHGIDLEAAAQSRGSRALPSLNCPPGFSFREANQASSAGLHPSCLESSPQGCSAHSKYVRTSQQISKSFTQIQKAAGRSHSRLYPWRSSTQIGGRPSPDPTITFVYPIFAKEKRRQRRILKKWSHRENPQPMPYCHGLTGDEQAAYVDALKETYQNMKETVQDMEL